MELSGIYKVGQIKIETETSFVSINCKIIAFAQTKISKSTNDDDRIPVRPARGGDTGQKQSLTDAAAVPRDLDAVRRHNQLTELAKVTDLTANRQT